MNRFRQLFGRLKRPAVIGMVHVKALPGSPSTCLSLEEIVESACTDASLYKKHKLDGVLVENMHDVPYLRPPAPPETVSCMARVCAEVKRSIGDLPMGVQILAGANREALAVAISSGAQFIRVEGFVFAHVADEGWMDGCAGELLRYRKRLGASDILIFTDVKKKHSSHAVTADVSLSETAQAAEFFLSDGVIVTGSSTGQPADKLDLEAVKECVVIPVLMGSGVTAQNVNDYVMADAIVVGSYFKHGGIWSNEISEGKVDRMMKAIEEQTE